MKQKCFWFHESESVTDLLNSHPHWTIPRQHWDHYKIKIKTHQLGSHTEPWHRCLCLKTLPQAPHTSLCPSPGSYKKVKKQKKNTISVQFESINQSMKSHWRRMKSYLSLLFIGRFLNVRVSSWYGLCKQSCVGGGFRKKKKLPRVWNLPVWWEQLILIDKIQDNTFTLE